MRRWVVSILAVVLVLVVVVLDLLFPVPCKVTSRNFDRIKDGMSRAEVHAILGAPGDHRIWPRRFATVAARPSYSLLLPTGRRREKWDGDEGMVAVTFSDEIVTGKTFLKDLNPPMHGLEQVRWRLSRAWNRWTR